MEDTTDGSVAEWVAAWGAEVSAADIRSGRQRFDADLVAFGTHADVVVGREAVEAGQWAKIWPAIEDFAFVLDELRVRMSPDGLFTAWFPTIRRGRDRRSQLREEGRQLGPPSDRETEPGAQRGRDRSGRDARRIHGDQCAMGGTRRPPRTPAR